MAARPDSGLNNSTYSGAVSCRKMALAEVVSLLATVKSTTVTA